ncbi:MULTISPECIES: SDR family oxidoreductase [Streptomyces]|uniref:NAD(P)H-binding protein n=1 Tax=Streptomyces griseocarneus TaxID=51201 RepID=A0ABX7RWC1_9ACTN|nr:MULTISPECIES: NAD(P)H-binding protein [Streptomyces]QSY51204.1 NAD(P)H-binding protein [Streptomyces griseocarneus]
MILITGGRGAVATHLLTLLREHGTPVRVASSAPGELDLPEDVPSVALDLTDPATFPAALAGVTSVFLYATADHITEFADRAAEAGVDHIVLLSSSSVLGPDPEDDLLAKSHLDVEKALLASPVATTILRPGAFAGNAGGWAWSIASGTPVSLPFPGAYAEPVHEKDVAEAAFSALTDPRHRGGRFTLTGPATMTFTEQIDQLAAVIGRPIATKRVTPEEWKSEMAAYVPGPYADALVNWWQSNDGKPGEPTGGVEDLTGHPARAFATWVADHAADFTR